MQTPSPANVILLHYMDTLYQKSVSHLHCHSDTLFQHFNFGCTVIIQLHGFFTCTNAAIYIYSLILLLYVRVCVCVCVHVCVPDRGYGVSLKDVHWMCMCLHKMSHSFISILYRSQVQWYGHHLLLHTVTDIVC